MSIQKKSEKYKRLIRSEKFQDKLRNISIPGFEGIPIYDVFVKFKEEIKNDDLSIRASSISFYFILPYFLLSFSFSHSFLMCQSQISMKK